ncbi:alpha/beta-hydrolase [Penicillium antarcticum]|uniref:alpha/beta-hydrolase n=1 Tax=Penicillium antarcticum TaxID=416450 RepID=UPI002387AA91|nr:alpha/beta-hydrolase [Penicillium antarcticum]KAJ5319997.1 alpha/beta-hydrolase [Penicillium antarcticum]
MTAGSRRSLPFPHWLYGTHFPPNAQLPIANTESPIPLANQTTKTTNKLQAHCQRSNYIFISADYRLIHPKTTADQITDAKALFTFLTSPAFKNNLPANTTLDSTRIAVSGFSAGAYSARAACIHANPKPAALISVYGLGGNMLLDHWTRGRPPTSIANFVDLESVSGLLADRAVVSDDFHQGDSPLSKRFALTVRWELDGTMLDGCFGAPGLGKMLDAVEYEEREGIVPEELREGFLQAFVKGDYPPSVFVHGTADEVVPPEESVYHYGQLRAMGVESELYLVEGGPHGLLEFVLESESVVGKETARAYEGALGFVDRTFRGVGGQGGVKL